MQSFIKKIELTPINQLSAVIVFLALLLAAQIQYIQHGWINPDSVLYFESARLIADGHWQEAIKVYNWPFYAALIATTHKLTSLGIQASAQVLNTLFFGLMAFSFTRIIRLAGGKQLSMVAGALILFSSQYIVGDILAMLIRDEGFWAFYLTGLAFFIRFYQHLRIRDALLWQLSAIIAILFRIEAVTYLVFLPILFLFSYNLGLKERIRYFFVSHALNIFLVLSLLLAIALHGDFSIKNFGRLQEIFTLNLYDELTRTLFEKAKIMSNDVLGKYLKEYAVQGILLIFVYIIIVKTIMATGLINSVLAGISIRNRRLLIEPKAYLALRFAAIISLSNMAIIITKVFVLSGRYVVALSLVLMVLAALMLAALTHKIRMIESRNSLKKWAYIALIVFLLLGIVKNIMPKREGYNYQQDAIAWLNTYNTHHENVFIDDSRLRFYAGQSFRKQAAISNFAELKNFYDKETIYKHTILVISSTKEHPESELFIAKYLPQYQEIKRFSNRKGNKQVVIYSLSNTAAQEPH